MIRQLSLHKNQSGVVSIVASIIIMVILSLIAISFARIMRQEHQQAFERQLHTQAYYAAETAINDVRQEVNQRLLDRQSADVLLDFEGWVRDGLNGIVTHTGYADVQGNGNNHNYFGRAIAFSGNFLAVGAHSNRNTPLSVDRKPGVHIYKRQTDGSWRVVFRIWNNSSEVPSDVDATPTTAGIESIPTSDSFGGSLAFSSDGTRTLAVGDSDSSQVRIFTKGSGDNWRHYDSDPNHTISLPTVEGFGRALDFIDDNSLVIGAGPDSGGDRGDESKVYIYGKNLSNTWVREEALPSNPCQTDYAITEASLGGIYRSRLNGTCTDFLKHTATVSAIAANRNLIAVATHYGFVNIYHNDGSGWEAHSLLPKRFNFGISGISISTDNLNDNRLVIAVASYANPDLIDKIDLFSYDGSLAWVETDSAEVAPLIDGLPDSSSNFGNYGLSLAFKNKYELAISGIALHSGLGPRGAGAVVLHRYFLPVTEQSLLEDEEECIVDSGPLSERFLDEDETVEYTCVLINTRPDLLIYDHISTERSLVVHLQPISASDGSEKQLTDLYVWWEDEADEDPDNQWSFSSFDQNSRFPPRSAWSRDAPVMMLQLIPVPDTAYDRDYLRQNTKTFFLYPSTGQSLAVWADDSGRNLSGTSSGEILEGFCDADGANPKEYPQEGGSENGVVTFKRHCGVKITAFDQLNIGTDHTYIMRLLSVYDSASVTVEGFAKDERVVFKDIQIVVDATARAGHVLRRIQERLPLVYVYDYPEYVLDIAEDICKDLESEPNQISRGRVENSSFGQSLACSALF